MNDETCDRCGTEEADHHLETMTTSECLCEHCVMVAMGLILAPGFESESMRTSDDRHHA